MLEKEVATQAQYDQALASRDAAIASLEAAKANTEAAKADQNKAAADLEQAKLDLGYTEVVAPIGGRITKTEIKLGNLVEDGDLMATIVDRDRIYANFNVSDRAILRLQKASQERAEADESEDEDEQYRNMPVFLQRELDEGFPFEGNLDYIDQEGVDQATGTFSLRAIFDNPEDLILPGLFVRVKVPIGEPEDSLLIPERAVSTDQMGSYVLVIDSEKKVDRRGVTTGQAYADMIVVEEGLGPDDWILLDGGQRARPGIEVAPTETELARVPELSSQTSPPTEESPQEENAPAKPAPDEPAGTSDASDDSPAQP